MDILYTILIGFVVGVVARFLKPGNDAMGWIMTTVLGIVGAFVAKFAAEQFGLGHGGFIASVVGAVVVLVIYTLVTRK